MGGWERHDAQRVGVRTGRTCTESLDTCAAHCQCSHPDALSPLLPAAKGKILGQLAEADKNLVDGSDEYLQLLAAAGFAQRVLTGRA